jgi:hypothetical protein
LPDAGSQLNDNRFLVHLEKAVFWPYIIRLMSAATSLNSDKMAQLASIPEAEIPLLVPSIP